MKFRNKIYPAFLFPFSIHVYLVRAIHVFHLPTASDNPLNTPYFFLVFCLFVFFSINV